MQQSSQQSEYLERQIISRIKKQNCKQAHCNSSNEDNIELIVFGNNEAKKEGLMCSQCFIDTQLISSLAPVENHALSVKKFLRVLSNYHNTYTKLRELPNFPTNQVKEDKQMLKKQIDQFQSSNVKNILQITQYVDLITKSALDQLRKAHSDKDLDKLVDLFNQQNEAEQERMILNSELIQISSKIRFHEGRYKLNSQDKNKKETQEIVNKYKKNMGQVIQTLAKLIEVHQKFLKNLLA